MFPDGIASVLYFDGSLSLTKELMTYGLILDGEERCGFIDDDVLDATRAELHALLHGLTWALESEVKHLDVVGDNMGVMHMVSGEHKVRNRDLKPFVKQGKFLVRQFETVQWFHLPGVDNPADAVARCY